MTRLYIISFIIKSQFSPFTNPKPLHFPQILPQALLLVGFSPSSPSRRISSKLSFLPDFPQLSFSPEERIDIYWYKKN
ncbi:hypothetical protein ZOSMA_70G00540 [Zostera marina]|uniref:Uncharacterized protein n=1 Tax=Zostera marina TaxID=29655 RepID=A0A0K9NSR3_ZOSMR|nr:hypothetical protein ZOSMA_70G00540 [Zostera marina]